MRKNTLQYLMGNPFSEFSDEDVTGVLITNKDFHKVKTKTYEMNLHLDSNKRYYSSCIGLNRYPFATGKYTVFF